MIHIALISYAVIMSAAAMTVIPQPFPNCSTNADLCRLPSCLPGRSDTHETGSTQPLDSIARLYCWIIQLIRSSALSFQTRIQSFPLTPPTDFSFPCIKTAAPHPSDSDTVRNVPRHSGKPLVHLTGRFFPRLTVMKSARFIWYPFRRRKFFTRISKLNNNPEKLYNLFTAYYQV